ncbi:ArsR family transcriptional regulator [Catellatospora bangladeshensis]|uniref:Transcriptional regulator n=1 Tax=Catellatospora bangladeshensis TaxID=310355 RepID=A0A8J3NLZ8_9ACTN|nr:ArsR family transcriptional regulator [Catellatospora bangladeshensis]GIF85572.1 transcriptional regulator [Catellatospora bangladeshensis]
MLRIELDEATLSRTRIAISPLWETVCALSLLGKPAPAPWPYTVWAANARRVLDARPADDPLRLYVDIGGGFPDCLLPVPAAHATIADELARIRDTPADLALAQYAAHFTDGMPELHRPFVTDTRAAFARVADSLAAFWRDAMAPYWPAMRTALEEEVLHRARLLAAEGPDALLSDLHERVTWQRPVLTLHKLSDFTVRATDKRLLLVPVLFSHGMLACSTDDPEVIAVTYAARGNAVLAGGAGHTARESDSDRLALLLGRGRTTILRSLTVPATTAGLAATLGLAPSTVSEHLSVLVEAGVAHRHRVGRQVLYGLEPAGLALVSLVSPG